MRYLILLILCSLTANLSFGQGKHPRPAPKRNPVEVEKLGKLTPFQHTASKPSAKSVSPSYQTLGTFKAPVLDAPNLVLMRDADTQLPIFGKGTIGKLEKGNTLAERSHAFLEVLKTDMQIQNPTEEFKVSSIQTDDLGMTHIRMQQYHKGLPVYGGEVLLHEKNNKIRSFNGRYYPTPQLEKHQAQLSVSEAFILAQQDVQKYTSLTDIAPENAFLVAETTQELVIFHKNNKLDSEKLAWHIQFHPNVREQWQYFVDAQTGEILRANRNSCSFACTHHHTHTHSAAKAPTLDTPPQPLTSVGSGPATANATDLIGATRTINVYEHQGTYFLIDASRTMFNPTSSNFPNDAVGVIWTIDGNNTSPQQGQGFNTTHVTSPNNSWSSPTSVSAHYNAGLAYEYFKNTFGRESINGQGGNIISIINVTDEGGNSMDNAFWNGQAMFYGNGGQAFEPLAKALDVAGHEMSHGVIQRTANLEYVAQSGSLNESFADIFGAMIDRNDWRMGEDVVNTQFFPSGALRDLANPNNGGNSLNDPGWQPAHMDEFQNLPNTPQGNNGGVHINSGIPNRAFYLLASNIGKNNAEDIYYRALTNYLTKSSQFIDCRIAVIQAATDLFGSASNEVAAAQNAFASVGIGSGQGTTMPEDIDENTGTEFILLSDASLSQIYVSNPDGSDLQVLSETAPLSKPSITDDGSAVVFIGTDGLMYAIEIDWATGNVDQFVLQNEPIWRNVAISKDGERIAALTNDNINEINIYDFGLQQWNTYTLYNPTYTQGISTGDVRYADVLEWDFSGEYVLYDAFNEIQSSFGENISYWDIGFMRAWDNNNNTWASPDGNIAKLFSGLPENTSIGNPTFAKNSPFIVAFDFIDENNIAQLMAVNTETGATSQEPIYSNGVLNYPNYSVKDDRLIFDAEIQGGGQTLGYVPVQADKINASGDPSIFIEGGKWGVWFAIGERDLVDVDVVSAEAWGITLFPNPTTNHIQIQAQQMVEDELWVTLSDMTGKQILAQKHRATNGNWTHTMDIKTLSNGTYLLKVRAGNQVFVQKVIKQ